MAKKLFAFDKPEHSPGFLLWQVTNLWQRNMREALEPMSLTHVQFVLLASACWLGMKKEFVTQQDIVEHAKTDKMMASKVLRTLQKKGLITRTEHKTDTRAKQIVVTPKGKSLLIKAVKTVEGTDHMFFSALSPKLSVFNREMLRLLEKNTD